ncbi:glycosyltransferase family 2 protein [Dermacoccus nishinomiyaensis]|uniref:glycosyltransferase family 2 protein n=1 Tax=Dermacoccus nishinomiyaensis TaxID=1274 RepID=UPI0021A8FCDE|nr:glycosyltransferase family 2 protein [Dermacoccus nishinomiyaensis]MCT1603381.1 glycosyltransferase family 2 protein [Dermacoccus nishinomiyaensis]
MRPALSIVVPHHGDPEPTRDLLAQLAAQRYEGAVQVIVSDDASPEPFTADGCDVVRRDRNGGFGSAVNSGVAVAEHDLLLVLNSDITIEESFLAELVDGAEPWMPAIVATRVEEPFGSRCVGRLWPRPRHVVLENLEPFARFHGRAWFEKQLGNDVASWDVPAARPTDWATGICLLMPAEEFRAVGGFDEDFFMNCEEVDLQRRLHRRGVPSVVLPSPIIKHVGGGSSDSTRRSQWLMDSRMRYHEKWSGGPGLALGLVGAAQVNLAWNSLRRIAGRDLDAQGAYERQMSLIRHAWRNRR